MRQMECCVKMSSPWDLFEEMIECQRWGSSPVAIIELPLTRVDRIRLELADGTYPLASHLDDILESLLAVIM